ncbi:hypothetical protein F5148DRAFT_135958 [Russula earlei]|uniref:Uncharacterized protein n=1 Tax=Russula earlei TaxID=71964 RepID=A0ACC0TQT2_9AGAM|nr:hypothetical protein F5148DRAFT_135958 [Russula earlei]
MNPPLRMIPPRSLDFPRVRNPLCLPSPISLHHRFTTDTFIPCPFIFSYTLSDKLPLKSLLTYGLTILTCAHSVAYAIGILSIPSALIIPYRHPVTFQSRRLDRLRCIRLSLLLICYHRVRQVFSDSAVPTQLTSIHVPNKRARAKMYCLRNLLINQRPFASITIVPALSRIMHHRPLPPVCTCTIRASRACVAHNAAKLS